MRSFGGYDISHNAYCGRIRRSFCGLSAFRQGREYHYR